MDEQKHQLVDKLKSSANILVTVRNNPSVDSLSACIGLTLMLNKMGKHASAVFSGEVPSTIEFLQPEDTLEKNTNSLRDFIIALDKSKADKLRYKVEDKVVKIFITPYKTSISQDDLDFSQGDFNVDCVVALGAHDAGELDQAITEHGRILHDATVMSINNANEGNLGSVNWQDNSASSLSEMIVELSKALDDKGSKGLLDKQIATALLTGIVAETERFSNDKTSAETMNISADLMEAGANQQLVASKLEEAMAIPANVDHSDKSDEVETLPPSGDTAPDEPPKDNGMLEVDHPADAVAAPIEPVEQDDNQPNRPTQPDQSDQPAPPSDNPSDNPLPEIRPLHPHDSMLPPVRDVPTAEVGDITGVNFISEQPSGISNATNLSPDELDQTADPLGRPHAPAIEHAMLSHNGSSTDQNQESSKPEPPPAPAPITEPVIPAPTFAPYTPPQPEEPKQPEPTPITSEHEGADSQTLTELEQAVHSPHAKSTDIDAARSEVLRALQESPAPPEPIAALGAQPLGNELHPQTSSPDISIDPNGNFNRPAMPTPPSPQGMPPGPAPLNSIGNEQAPNPMSPADRPMDMPLPPSINIPPPQPAPPTNPPGNQGTPPPPVPPPMLPPFPS